MSSATAITLDVFTKSILPLMRTKHHGGDALAQAIKSFVAETPIVDESGNEIDVDALVVEEDESGNTSTKSSDADIEHLVKQALARMSKSTHKNVVISGGETRVDDRTTSGFKAMGEFALAVHKASAPGGSIDARLQTKAPTTFASEGAGGSGGFMVPQEWSDQLWDVVLGEESLLSRTNQIPTSRNSLSLPVSESTPWGNGGVQAYWADEGDQITQSRPQFEHRNLRLHKLAALVPASDELLDDATALDAFVGREAARAIRYKADDAIVNGDGVGKPLGVLHSDALVTVTEEVSQAADTLVGENVVKMYARMPAPNVNNAVWLINQDVLPQLLSMTLGDQLVYMPPNGIGDAPFGTLLGRPVILSQHANGLGNEGDILFVDFSQYLALIKADGMQSSSSIHLWFDYDVTAFRFTFRLAGQPWLSSPITPDNGSDTLSPFVTLAERA